MPDDAKNGLNAHAACRVVATCDATGPDSEFRQAGLDFIRADRQADDHGIDAG